jgi:hypothetical protein
MKKCRQICRALRFLYQSGSVRYKPSLFINFEEPVWKEFFL